MAPPHQLDFKHLAFPLFIAGPAYSGKSQLAIDAFSDTNNQKVTTIGTAQISDPAFNAHLNKLKDSRPTHWVQVTASEHLAEEIISSCKTSELVVIDSINQWLGNIFAASEHKYDGQQFYQLIQRESKRLLNAIEENKDSTNFIIISSEQGAGPSPSNAFARLYRQTLGRLNEKLASTSQSVLSVQWGIPNQIK
jgi:adenosylcobinamide kinase/adenosylcobinamide-phosphate guanylyltransferase